MADVSAEALNAPALDGREPISALLEKLKRDVPQNRVTFGWLADYWNARSPEAPILFLALIGVLPGVSVAMGPLIALLAGAMLSSQPSQALPAFIASRELSTAHIVRTIDRSVPWFLWSERFVRRRDASLIEAMRPVCGLVILALSLTLLVPLPLSNVIPALAIAAVAFASIEGDGLLLGFSLAASLVSLVLTFAAVWAAAGAAAWIWG